MDDFEWDTSTPSSPTPTTLGLDQILARGYHSQLTVGSFPLTVIGQGNNTFTKTGTAGRRLYALRMHADGTGSVYPYVGTTVDWEHPVVDHAPVTLR